MVHRACEGNSHRALSKRLGEFFLRLLQRLFSLLALGNIHRHAKHPLGGATLCVIKRASGCDPANRSILANHAESCLIRLIVYPCISECSDWPT